MAKILIVEDDQELALMLAKRLSFEGYATMTAFDAIRARSFIHKENPDLIILDLMLPAGAGAQILEHIRFTKTPLALPVIVTTAANSEKIKEQMIALGANAYLEKPYNFEDLKVILQDLLKNKNPS